MNKIFRMIAFVPAALLMVACGGSKKSGSNETSAPAESRAILVDTATAVTAPVPHSETYTSTVEAYAVNNIAPQTGGRIENIKVDVGSFVSKGQLLATMDASQLDQTYLKLVNDSTELVRLKSLYEEGGVSKSDYDAAEMAYKVSRRSYHNLRENAYLTSPISGVITARNYDKGDLYSGTPIFVVQQITPVKLLVSVSESDYTNVKVGNSVTITADALPGSVFTGRINKIYPTINPSSHTFITEVLVNNADRVLRPGMFARVTIEFGINNSIIVPEEAVGKIQGSGQKCVYVLGEDNTAKLTLVKVGRLYNGSYEILEGLNVGDVVATKGSSSLKDGSSVSIASNR
ncbi:MAG: efflux RND transporter periplasmic adaptor subunit [Candidatus Cryptobacteroides sp.]